MRDEISKLQIPLPIAIVGLGLSGNSVHELLLAAGIPDKDILTFDQKGPAQFQDPETLLRVGQPKTLCVSPGVHLQSDWIQKALSSGLRLTSELEVGFSFLTNEKVIAITGSVGKSTTTSILGSGVSAIDPKAFVGGNLGLPLADYAKDLIQKKRSPAEYVILELSSYQLENFKNFKSRVSVLSHLSPNHLERYKNLSHYFETKLEIFKNTTELGVLNRSGGSIAALIDQIQKSNSVLRWVWTDRNDPLFKKLLKENPALVGAHNLDNLAVAFAVANHFSWPEESYSKMIRFPGLAHRLENCGELGGILFLNDSKATSIHSVLQAFQSVRQAYPQREIHLLLGGKDKNLPWDTLGALKTQGQLSISFFGEVGRLAQEKSGLSGSVFATFKECLSSLRPQLKSGEILLLSPGGTSWDEFKSFEERGAYFKKWILSEFQSH